MAAVLHCFKFWSLVNNYTFNERCVVILFNGVLSTVVTMNFDEVLIEIGEFGTYQKRIYFLLCLPSINAVIFMTISVFLMATPDHR